MSKDAVGPNKFTDEEQQQIDNIVGKSDAQGINWQQWAYKTLAAVTAQALSYRNSLTNYIGLRCPRCARIRLMPELTSPNTAKLTCEKCNWQARGLRV